MILILYLVKASVVISVAAGTLAIVGRKSSAALRHLICTLAIAGLLALPILSAIVPQWSITNVGGPANHLRQGYGGPPKPSAKEEAGRYLLSEEVPGNHLSQGFGDQEALSRRSRQAKADGHYGIPGVSVAVGRSRDLRNGRPAFDGTSAVRSS